MKRRDMYEIGKHHAELLTFCYMHNRIHLYGAGVVAQRLLFVLIEERLNIKDAIVTKRNCDQDFLICNSIRLPVVSISEVEIRDEDGIIIATAEDGNAAEMIGNLHNIGIDDRHIFIQSLFDIADLDFLSWDNMHTSMETSYFFNYKELNNIGLQTDTDKAEHRHNFLNKYEFFLKRYRDESIKLIELGIYYGGSVNMWRRYFKKAKIYGVDIDEGTLKCVDDGIDTMILDLGNSSSYDKICSIKPDVIIDDASHIWSHQVNALINLVSAHNNKKMFESLENTDIFGHIWYNRDA